MTTIEKIRAEIERRIQRENEILWNAKLRGTYPSPSCEYNLLTLTSLRDFLDTLSEEPDKSLEEAADEYEKGYFDDCSAAKRAAYHGFKAGAKWQKEQMLKDYSWLMAPCPNIEPKADIIHTTDTAPVDGKELLHVADKSYKIGWRDCKQQMLKDAEPAEIGYFNQRGLSILTEKAIERMPVSEGDKVRIIIVKEEEK